VELGILVCESGPRLSGFAQSHSLKLVVVAAVIELFPDPTAFQNLARGGVDTEASIVKEPVQIAAHQETVRDFVALRQRVWLDVGSIKNRKSPLPADCATAFDGGGWIFTSSWP